MDNEAIKPSLVGDKDAVAEPAPVVTGPEAGRGLAWRIVIAVAAVVVLAVLVYPLVQPGQESGSPAGATVPATLSAPEVNAQASPGSAEAQFELGNAYAQAGQWEQARAAYQQAIELDPNHQSAYANLGVVYYQLEQLDLAASQYQKALELDPDDGEVAYNLGALYLQQALLSGAKPDPAQVERAITQLRHASELAPDLAEPYFSLGVAYQLLGRKDEATQAFETFLARDTARDPRARQEAERYLELLRQP